MSDLEQAFLTYWRQLAPGAPDPVQGFQFARDWTPRRKWAFDFAWPAAMVAVELEGGSWVGGRHTRPAGYARDAEKYSEAALAGWTVVRLTGDMLTDDPMRWVCAVAAAVAKAGEVTR